MAPNSVAVASISGDSRNWPITSAVKAVTYLARSNPWAVSRLRKERARYGKSGSRKTIASDRWSSNSQLMYVEKPNTKPPANDARKLPVR